MSLVESELGGPTVFKDLSKLDFDYVPDELPSRDEEIRQLARFYRGLGTSGQREHVLVTGPVGAGKTAIAKRFGQELKGAITRKGKRLDVVYVNCRRRKSAGLAALGIINHFDPGYPERGFGVGEVLRDLRKHLENKDAHVLVILDEVDALLRADGSDLVYDLTRFNDEGPMQQSQWPGISLILISQHDNVLESMDDAARSTFKSNVLRLAPYTGDALEHIAAQRVRLAFYPGTVDDDTIFLVADAASSSGNARQVIEILMKAGMLADQAGVEVVKPEYVREAKADVYSFITESKLTQLGLHPQLVLLALARRLRRDESAYCTTGIVENNYQLVCEEFDERPRAHTQFWKYVKQLSDAGIIMSRISGKGQAGTTQHISIPDAPAHAVEARLLALLGEPKN